GNGGTGPEPDRIALMPSAMPAVLLLDGLWNKTVAAARSLGKRGYRVSVGERTRFAPALFSKYCSRRFLHPSPATSPDAFLDALEKELRVGGYDVLLAMELGTQVLVARNRPRLEGMARFPFASADLAIRVQDKGELASFASAHGVECPATFRPKGPGDVHAMASRLPYPLLVKPRLSSGGRGIVRVETPSQLRKEYPKVHAVHPSPILQECLPPGGEALGVGVLMNFSSEPRATFAYRRLREYPVGGGPSTLRESVRDETLCRMTERLLSALGWTGVAMAEFKVDPRDGRPKLLEVNPRFWGSLHHAILSGVDFPHLLCRMAIDGDIPPLEKYGVGVRSRSLIHGDLMHFVRNPRRFHLDPGFLDFSIQDDLLSASDPWPMLGRVATLIPACYDRELRKTMLG
ncbi:MAG TPA: ATP-grasp domain-containing protein, partial [Thermodesulfobacteriota bacterium]|nr:ATP-grasp domain-containing protein [Thermodesulfobacteriota bacterium]